MLSTNMNKIYTYFTSMIIVVKYSVIQFAKWFIKLLCKLNYLVYSTIAVIVVIILYSSKILKFKTIYAEIDMSLLCVSHVDMWCS